MNKKTPRTYDEAYETAEYCSAIEKPSNTTEGLARVFAWCIVAVVLICGISFMLPARAKDTKYSKTVKAISTKYNKDPVQVAHIVDTAVEVSESKGIDPVLTLAVIATESEFNPNAYNKTTGASGLTQVLAGMHAKLISSYKGSIFDPLVAINVGTDLIKTFMSWQGGSTKRAMNQYGGDSTGAYYNKVMYNYNWIDKTIERDL